MKRLLLATNNTGKIVELSKMLADIPIELIGLDSKPDVIEVEETGATFIENAHLKARGYALQAGLPALADDSGLEVDALGGRPGVLSARYAGEDTGFDHKIKTLLAEIAATGYEDRTARFVCSMAIADASGKILHTSEGKCEGKIALAPRGSHGFGYDPVFIPEGFDRTFGELENEIKAQISHRERAFSQIIPFLLHFIAN